MAGGKGAGKLERGDPLTRRLGESDQVPGVQPVAVARGDRECQNDVTLACRDARDELPLDARFC